MDNPNDASAQGVPESLASDPLQTFNPTTIGLPSAIAPGEGVETASLPPVGEFSPRRAEDYDSGFTLRRVIARGGFGEVWEAVQGPLRRVVAIKRMRRDLAVDDPEDSRQASFYERSFREEALTAAQLDHPNIVPIHDMPMDSDGRPMLAMKLVRGEPWDVVIHREFATMGVEDFLARHVPILIDVSQAVAFAHARGIVHRDLKPAQVMLGEFGEVLLTDWGLAVNFDPEVLEQTKGHQAVGCLPTPTEASNPAGTPAFMAPEQTETTARNIGPWTDVYLLGGILFMLLTGRPPRSRGGGPRLFVQAISGEFDGFEEAEAQSRAIPADLRALCLECLEPLVARRSVTTARFVARLQEHLSGARDRSASAELTESLARRLDAGMSDYHAFGQAVADLTRARALWPGNPASRALADRVHGAFARVALKRGDLVLARVQAESMEPHGERDTMLREVDTATARAVARERTRRALVAATAILTIVILVGAMIYNRRLTERAEAEAAARREAEESLAVAKEQGTGAFDLVTFVLRDLKTAMEEELTPEHGVSGDEASYLSSAIAGKVASPVVEYFEGLDARGWPRDLQLSNARRMVDVGLRFRDMGRYDEAVRLTSDSLAQRIAVLGPDAADVAESHNQLGALLNEAGKWQLAGGHLERALAIWEKEVGPEHPYTASCMNNLGSLYSSMGDLERAEAMYRRTLEVRRKVLGPDHEDTALSLNNLGTVLQARDDFAGARDAYAEALRIAESTVGPEDPLTATFISNLASALGELQEMKESEELLRRALAIREKVLGPSHPSTATSVNNLALLLHNEGREEEALEMFERVRLAYVQAYGPVHPSVGVALYNQAAILRAMNRNEEALAKYRESLEVREQSLGPNHLDTAQSLSGMGGALARLGRAEEALDAFNRAVAIREAALPAGHVMIATTRLFRGEVRLRMGDLDGAAEDLEAARPVLEGALSEKHPNRVFLESSLKKLEEQRGAEGSKSGTPPSE